MINPEAAHSAGIALRALSYPTSRRVFDTLWKCGELNQTTLCKIFRERDQAAISLQLKKMVKCGLVKRRYDRKIEKFVYYSIDRKNYDKVVGAVNILNGIRNK